MIVSVHAVTWVHFSEMNSTAMQLTRQHRIKPDGWKVERLWHPSKTG